MLRGMPRKDVILTKRNGEEFELKALVQPKNIYLLMIRQHIL